MLAGVDQVLPDGMPMAQVMVGDRFPPKASLALVDVHLSGHEADYI